MASNLTLGEQLKGILDSMKYYDENMSSTGVSPDSFSSGLMSLIWPLLPLLPPEPPRLVTELLGRQEACDICGLSAAEFVPVDTGLRQRFPNATPLDALIVDVEKKMEETLNSIEKTTRRNEELSKQRKELDRSAKSEPSDAEMLKKLKSLVDEKARREAKVKSLEVKEQKLRDSLMAAINWARDIETRKLSDEKGANQEMGDDEKSNQQSEEVATA